MSGLFRPWAEMVHQDSTVSTTTAAMEVIVPEGDPREREIRFKNVKEHIRKRTEKKKKRGERKCENKEKSGLESVPGEVVSDASSPALLMGPWPCHGISPFSGVKDCHEDLSPELLEIALAQGLPPVLVEEYARMLTEQQRHATEKSRKQRPKKFRCPHCQVGFSNNGQLKGHIRIHTGERPFKCEADSCGKSFTRNEELTRHRRIHSGLRPFPCPDCGKRFGRKDHLKKHIRTHYQQKYQLVPILPLTAYPYLYGY